MRKWMRHNGTSTESSYRWESNPDEKEPVDSTSGFNHP